MSAAAVLTNTIDPTSSGLILTFLTPSRNGCGMACGYCFIDRRREDTAEGELRPQDYSRLIGDAAKLQLIAAVTIQGREPLEPSALPWTKEILAAAAAVGAETGLVTNGLWLEDAVPLLVDWGCAGVTVSIDAATPSAHDRLRRSPGAWQRAMAGLRALVSRNATARVTVNSLLFPGARERLAELPRHLAQNGVKTWSLAPMLRFDANGQPSAAISADDWVSAVRYLSERAAEHGVSVVADDEFRCMGDSLVPGATLRTLSRPGGIMRMGPDGRCSFGRDILGGVNHAVLVWGRDTEASEVVGRMVH